ncbi:hypothetical protein [uncultured Sphingomonas sp.]|uniref:hypothetical protein n=1 Tax=uncultured Sphingomonas sp. TaxID=158754 RepID=UPI0025DDE365|nr:hypothetical protein [uncultured Sphingomonas sp.]
MQHAVEIGAGQAVGDAAAKAGHVGVVVGHPAIAVVGPAMPEAQPVALFEKPRGPAIDIPLAFAVIGGQLRVACWRRSSDPSTASTAILDAIPARAIGLKRNGRLASLDLDHRT